MVYNYPYSNFTSHINNNVYPYYTSFKNSPVYSKYAIEKNNSKKNNETQKNENNNTSESTIISILGLQLNFDDILLICLIIFLYNEKTNDTYLFLALILLLLS